MPVPNIWEQPLSGGPPHPVTNFTSGRIFGFAWSRAGKNLYLAKGEVQNDVGQSGELYLNSEPVSAEELTQKLGGELARRADRSVFVEVIRWSTSAPSPGGSTWFVLWKAR